MKPNKLKSFIMSECTPLELGRELEGWSGRTGDEG